MKARLLVVDDERLIRTSLERALAALGHEVEAADTIATATAAIARTRFDAIILDLKLPDGSGLDVVRTLGAESPETKIVVITAHGTVDAAVEAMKLGAFDFVNKPFELDELLTTVQNALRAGTLERRLAYHDGRARSRFDADMVAGRSPRMAELEREVAMVAPQPVPVILVVGETGSGKALVARRLHYGAAGARAGGPFVELNAAAMPETLIESELFGHERGAFSDARERKLGLVEAADGGTLFLDEIGDLPRARAGEAADVPRVVQLPPRRRHRHAHRRRAARGRDQSRSRRDGQGGPLPRRSLLPARARSRCACRRSESAARTSRRSPSTSSSATRSATARASAPSATKRARCSTAWPWPGNVRELKAVVQRAVLMNDAATLEVAHLPAELVAAALDPVPSALAPSPTHIPTLDEIELRYMRAVLQLTGGNKVRAAEHLGITRQTLAKRLGETE